MLLIVFVCWNVELLNGKWKAIAGWSITKVPYRSQVGFRLATGREGNLNLNTPNPFEFRRVVEDAELDILGHVNNVEYVRWMQDAAVAHISSLGWPTSRHLENGFVWVAHSHAIQYRQPAMAGDAIVVRTWVENMRKVRSLRKYEIFRETDNALLAKAETDWALLRTSDQRPMRIPKEIVAIFELESNPK